MRKQTLISNFYKYDHTFCTRVVLTVSAPTSGARNQYVDVLSNKTTPAATVPSTLFNVMPMAAPTTNTSAQIFNPTGSGR